MIEKRNAYRHLVEKAERRRPLGRPKCRWEDNRLKPVLKGISRAQNIFPLKPDFRLIKVYYDSHWT
jgi:hypothetical protein